MLRAALFAAALLLAGCGAPGAAPADMARGPTDHPPSWPVASKGGAVQPAAELYTVVWPGDEALGAATADFAAWMLGSDYWTRSLAEYGVGPGTSMGVVVLPSPAPATMTGDDIMALAKMLLQTGKVAPGANTQVAFLPPPATTLTTPDGVGCQDFAGYHGWLSSTAGPTAFSVNLRCRGEAGVALDQVTMVLSHEAAESATDPNPDAPTFIAVDPSPTPYEIADLCNFNSGISVDVPADATHAERRYWVQRLYSAQRAADGTKDPCVPLPWDRPYWNVALDPEVMPRTTADPLTFQARLDVFAYGDVGLVKWFAVSADGSAHVTPSSGRANAGDTIPVTITLDSAATGVHEIDVLSESEKAGAAMWFSYVTVKTAPSH